VNFDNSKNIKRLYIGTSGGFLIKNSFLAICNALIWESKKVNKVLFEEIKIDQLDDIEFWWIK